MQKPKGLSLRVKLLILLITIPLISMIVYAVVAIDLFKKDKLAYVYDSCAVVANSHARQVEAEIQSQLRQIEILLQGFSSKKNQFSKLSRTLFTKYEKLMQLQVLEKKDGQWVSTSHLTKSDFSSNQSINDWKLDLLNFSSNIAVQKLSATELVLFVKPELDTAAESEQLFMSVFNVPKLSENFESSETYLNHLVGPEGRTLFAPGGLDGSFATWDFFAKLQNNLEQQSFAGNSPDGRAMIVSRSSVNLGGLSVVTLIEESRALSAVKSLMTRSLLFFVVVISFAFFISLLASKRLTETLNNLFLATGKVAEGDYNVQVNVHSKDEVGLLADSFNSMAQKITLLIEDNIEKARMETELKTAQAVQGTLFPKNNATFGPFEISGFYQSASECGGDWWHYSEFEGKIYLWIGDATGHGAPAALITAAAKTVSTMITRLPNRDPALMMDILNESIFSATEGEMCMTFFICSIEKSTGKMICCNCSHEPPILIPAKTEIEKKDLVTIQGPVNKRLGHAADAKFSSFETSIKPGEKLYFYTDGVTELMNESDQYYKERRLINALQANQKKSADLKAFVEGLKQDLYAFKGDAELKDDVTFFACKYSDV